MEDAILIGKVIRNLRLAKALSQVEVAELSDTNLSYYCKIERGEGNPTVQKLHAITRTLGISPVEFWELVELEKRCVFIFPKLFDDSIA